MSERSVCLFVLLLFILLLSIFFSSFFCFFILFFGLNDFIGKNETVKPKLHKHRTYKKPDITLLLESEYPSIKPVCVHTCQFFFFLLCETTYRTCTYYYVLVHEHAYTMVVGSKCTLLRHTSPPVSIYRLWIIIIIHTFLEHNVHITASRTYITVVVIRAYLLKSIFKYA